MYEWQMKTTSMMHVNNKTEMNKACLTCVHRRKEL